MAAKGRRKAQIVIIYSRLLKIVVFFTFFLLLFIFIFNVKVKVNGFGFHVVSKKKNVLKVKESLPKNVKGIPELNS